MGSGKLGGSAQKSPALVPQPPSRNPLVLTGPPSDSSRCPPAHGAACKRPATVAKRRPASPHPDPTGNGGPRNGDYVRLGGVARDPLPHPARGLASARPPHLPHRPRQSSRASRGRPIGLAAQPPSPPPWSDKEGAAAHDTREPTGRPGAPSIRGVRVPSPQVFFSRVPETI